MAISYRKAGVNIAAGERVVQSARSAARSTLRPEVVAGVGGFGGMFRIPKRYHRPLLVTSTDGVGTKLRVAFMLGRHDTVGIDLVAMNVNDILTLGAEPVVFLDYFACGKLKPGIAADVLKGVARGCELAGCSLIGGETAELPSFYAPGEYDLAGFTVGVVDEDEVVDGRRIAPGDVLIGLPSSGIHSNGYSLARHICFEVAGLKPRSRPRGLARPLGEELLTPTRIYVKTVLGLPRARLKGMAHITGGGFPSKLGRILPEGRRAVVRIGSWPILPVFELLQRLGKVSTEEMFRTFNMGVGFILVVAQRDADTVMAALRRRREPAYVIGEIVAATRRAAEAVTLTSS